MAENQSQNSTWILETLHLSRSIADKNLVEDVSIQVAHGDVLAVVGPSGAGKSSFLRLINRLDEPTGGTVLLEGRDYREIEPRQLRRRVGMVLQAPNLFPGTVASNLAYGPRQRGEAVAPDRIEQLLEQVALPGYQDRDIQGLSGGEAQRVSLARTLMNSPEILLLDEPTSALDPAAEQEVEALLTRIIQEQKLTCLMITHDMEQAGRLFERAMLMRAGKLVQVGPVAEVIYAQSNA
jgi:putative ABC transport system ATP-binding protein